MKKTITIALSLLMWIVSTDSILAQPELQKGMETKEVEPEFISTAHYIGEYQGLTCWVGNGRRHNKQVVLMDNNLNVKRAVTLKYDDEYNVLATALDSNRAAIVLMFRDGKRLTKLYGSVVDLDTMRSVHGDRDYMLLDSMAYGRKDRCHVWAATSPDRTKLGLVTVVEYTENKQYSARARLFDAKLDEQWVKNYALGTTDEICVSDDGMVVTLGRETMPDKTILVVNVMSAHKSDTYEATVKCEPLIEMRLAGMSGHNMMAIGTFSTPGSDLRDEMCSGVAGLSFNVDSGIVNNFVLRAFTSEDINILLNKKTKKIQRHLETDLVSIAALTTTPYGAVACLGRNYLLNKPENDGTTSDIFYRTGLHMFALNADGTVRWVRNLRRNDMQKKYDDLLNIALTTVDDDVLLLKNEHSKYPSGYDISDDAKEMEAGDKSNMVFYTIGPDGETHKVIVEQKTKQTLLRAEKGSDNRLIYLTRRGSRSRAASLKFHKP